MKEGCDSDNAKNNVGRNELNAKATKSNKKQTTTEWEIKSNYIINKSAQHHPQQQQQQQQQQHKHIHTQTHKYIYNPNQ